MTQLPHGGLALRQGGNPSSPQSKVVTSGTGATALVPAQFILQQSADSPTFNNATSTHSMLQ